MGADPKPWRRSFVARHAFCTVVTGSDNFIKGVPCAANRDVTDSLPQHIRSNSGWVLVWFHCLWFGLLRLVDLPYLISSQGIIMSAVSEDQPAISPTANSVHSDGSSSTARLIHYGSDLFSYDQRTAANQILISGDTSYSKVEYDEYVVYTKPSVEHKAPTRGRRKRRHSETHVTHRFSQDDTSGAAMLDLAFRNDFTLDRNVRFLPSS